MQKCRHKGRARFDRDALSQKLSKQFDPRRVCERERCKIELWPRVARGRRKQPSNVVDPRFKELALEFHDHPASFAELLT